MSIEGAPCLIIGVRSSQSLEWEIQLATLAHCRYNRPRNTPTQHRGRSYIQCRGGRPLPHLTVGDTLIFRSKRPNPEESATRIEQDGRCRPTAAMSWWLCSESAARVNTRVGNEYVRGVSGGERKRVSIAEAALSGRRLCSVGTTARTWSGLGQRNRVLQDPSSAGGYVQQDCLGLHIPGPTGRRTISLTKCWSCMRATRSFSTMSTQQGNSLWTWALTVPSAPPHLTRFRNVFRQA